MHTTSIHPQQGGDLLVHVDRSRLALVQAHGAVLRRVLVLRRSRDADGTFVERLRDALAVLAPERVLTSGFRPAEDAHLAAAVRRLASRHGIPIVPVPDVRQLARQLRHRLGASGGGGHGAPPGPGLPRGPVPPAPARAVSGSEETPTGGPRSLFHPPYVHPALALA